MSSAPRRPAPRYCNECAPADQRRPGRAGLRVDAPGGGPYDGAERCGGTVMAQGPALEHLADFADILKRDEPLAPYTYLKLGGPAEALVQPRSRDELAAVVRRCFD